MTAGIGLVDGAANESGDAESRKKNDEANERDQRYRH